MAWNSVGIKIWDMHPVHIVHKDGTDWTQEERNRYAYDNFQPVISIYKQNFNFYYTNSAPFSHLYLVDFLNDSGNFFPMTDLDDMLIMEEDD